MLVCYICLSKWDKHYTINHLIRVKDERVSTYLQIRLNETKAKPKEKETLMIIHF